MSAFFPTPPSSPGYPIFNGPETSPDSKLEYFDWKIRDLSDKQKMVICSKVLAKMRKMLVQSEKRSEGHLSLRQPTRRISFEFIYEVFLQEFRALWTKIIENGDPSRRLRKLNAIINKIVDFL